MGANKEELAKLQLKAIKLSRLPQAPSGVCATYVYPHLCTGHISSPHRNTSTGSDDRRIVATDDRTKHIL